MAKKKNVLPEEDEVIKDDPEKDEDIDDEEIEDDDLEADDEVEESEEELPELEDIPQPEKKNYRCPKCGIYYVNQKWVHSPETSLGILKSALAYCNKCIKKTFDDDYIGRVEIRAKNLEEIQEDIMDIAERVERTLEFAESFEKILSAYKEDDIYVIHTNTTRLAREIGKNVLEEFKGGIEYSWIDKNQYLIVRWYDEMSNSQELKQKLRRKKERFTGSYFFEEDDK